MHNPAEDIINIMRERKLTLGTVESATGGLIASLITDIPGSSDVFKGSIISYGNDIKRRVVGVRAVPLEQNGAVSSQVAWAMSKGGKKVLGVDICVSDTGIAGPGGATPEKPAGLFYFGISHANGTFTQKHVFKGSRTENKQQAALTALNWVKEYLDSLS
jgi:nicotinamide-nucleotide amidase